MNDGDEEILQTVSKGKINKNINDHNQNFLESGKELPSTQKVITFMELYDKEVSVIHAFGLLMERKIQKNEVEKLIGYPIEYKGKLNLLTAILNKNCFKKRYIYIENEDELMNLIAKLT